MRIATYNLLDYGRSGDSDRERLIPQVIESLDADIMAVQEIWADRPQEAAERLEALAASVGMTARYRPTDGVAVGFGAHNLAVGLMWRPDIVRPAGSLRAYDGDMWHNLIRGTFHLDGNADPVQIASYHAPPFGLHGGAQAREAERVISALTRPFPAPPAIIGADWNVISADRTTEGDYWDPDPYADAPWIADFIYQCRWTYATTGERTDWHADRTATDVLYAGGLHDAAVAIANRTPGARPEPTVGHWPTDPFPPRRIDALRVTPTVSAALRESRTIDNDLTRIASDHLPVIVDLDSTAITHEI